MTKQLALQQVFGDGIAVDCDKRSILSQAPAMNSQRGHLFAGATFAEQENRRGGFCYFANVSKHTLHLRAVTKHVFETIGPNILLQPAVLFFQIGDINTPSEKKFEFLHLNWLAQEVISPGADRLQGILLFALAGNNDHLRGIVDRQ